MGRGDASLFSRFLPSRARDPESVPLTSEPQCTPSGMEETNPPARETARAQRRKPAGCVEQLFAAWIVSMKMRLLPPTGGEKAEECLHELQSKMQVLHRNAEELETRMRAIGREALQAKNRGDRTRAAMKVRDRRRLESQLERVQRALDFMASQEAAIQSADMDRGILEALESSNDAIKRVGLDEESAERANLVIDELEQHLDRSAEIQEQMVPLSRMNFGEVEVDETALEEEFAILEAEQSVKDSYLPVIQVQRDAHTARLKARQVEAEARAEASIRPASNATTAEPAVALRENDDDDPDGARELAEPLLAHAFASPGLSVAGNSSAVEVQLVLSPGCPTATPSPAGEGPAAADCTSPAPGGAAVQADEFPGAADCTSPAPARAATQAVHSDSYEV